MNVPAWVFGDDAFAQYLSRLYWGKIKNFFINCRVLSLVGPESSTGRKLLHCKTGPQCFTETRPFYIFAFRMKYKLIYK